MMMKRIRPVFLMTLLVLLTLPFNLTAKPYNTHTSSSPMDPPSYQQQQSTPADMVVESICEGFRPDDSSHDAECDKAIGDCMVKVGDAYFEMKWAEQTGEEEEKKEKAYDDALTYWESWVGSACAKKEAPVPLPCGNGTIDAGEDCDIQLALEDDSCSSLKDSKGVNIGYVGGKVSCDATCRYDTAVCESPQPESKPAPDPDPPSCNKNNKKETGEQCDGTDLGSLTADKGCLDPQLKDKDGKPFTAGTLSCDSSCRYDISKCTIAAADKPKDEEKKKEDTIDATKGKGIEKSGKADTVDDTVDFIDIGRNSGSGGGCGASLIPLTQSASGLTWLGGLFSTLMAMLLFRSQK